MVVSLQSMVVCAFLHPEAMVHRLHSRPRTPTALYGVPVLSSLESYGHIVLGHPQRSCRIGNLPYSGPLVA